MATSAELNTLTIKQLGSIAKELAVQGWHEMRKDELVRSIISKGRSKSGGERLKKILRSSKFVEFKIGKTAPAKSAQIKSGSIRSTSVKPALPKAKKKSAVVISAAPSLSPKVKSVTSNTASGVEHGGSGGGHVETKPNKRRRSPKSDDSIKSGTLRDRRKESPRKLASTEEDLIRTDNAALVSERSRLSRDLGTSEISIKEDQLALTVRGPFWLHAFWQLSSRTIERIKVSMGHFWYTAVPILRIFRLDSDSSMLERRRLFREIKIHGGVRHWYIDVIDPPSAYQAELGYLSKEKKFHLLVSSNTVETPPRQIVDDLDKLDDNWREIDENLARIYKLSTNDTNNADLKRVFEKHLNRPMSQPLISRYKSMKQKGGSASGVGNISEKTRRNFNFNIDADIIIHGKTDPSVQVTVKNEPITINSDGTFSVRFSIPEKRHVFPIEAESSDGVEVQRVILTMERNTRILETLFQEHSEDD
ncbi:MAG: DUF4912 domain-containing protein [Planctomycetaceae bacterium]|nr:DUF4912 domain-containing protein [Planctomycetaceae bacterium]